VGESLDLAVMRQVIRRMTKMLCFNSIFPHFLHSPTLSVLLSQLKVVLPVFRRWDLSSTLSILCGKSERLGEPLKQCARNLHHIGLCR